MTSVPSNQFLCHYESHCFSLCMCCDFFGCDCRMQCPDGCSCFHDSTWSSNIIFVTDISNNTFLGLMDLQLLDLSGNELEMLEGQEFSDLVNLSELYLQGNKL